MTNASRKRCPLLSIRRVRRLLVTSLRAGCSEGGLMAVAGWSTRAMIDRYTAASASERAAAEARNLALGNL